MLFDHSIPRVSVHSSNLRSVGYDAWSGRLDIEFHGGRLYTYFHVPPQVYDDLMRAESKGRFFYYHIRGNYDYRRIYR